MYLRGKRYENEKKITAGAPKGNENAKKQCHHNDDIELEPQQDKFQNQTRFKLAKAGIAALLIPLFCGMRSIWGSITYISNILTFRKTFAKFDLTKNINLVIQ